MREKEKQKERQSDRDKECKADSVTKLDRVRQRETAIGRDRERD